MNERFSIGRTLRLGLFNIGSALGDLLGTAVWNRVMIGDLGVAATPVALLAALRYVLAPISIWAGYRSDTRPIFGLHRLPYIWGGRALMLLALPLLPLSTVLLAANTSSFVGWLLATLSFVLYGLGSLFSGGPFLALVRDNAPPANRGQALAIVQTMLVASFAFSPAIYSLLMPSYDPALFARTVLVGGALALLFWVAPLIGAEPRRTVADEPPAPFWPVLREIWSDRRTRAFFMFLALSAASGFAQDAILEPFGSDVFGLDVGATTRFNAYWGGGVLLSMLGTSIVIRRRLPAEQVPTTALGLVCSALPLALLGAVAIGEMQWLLIPALFLFGLGFGIYTIGALSLLMAMTSDHHAGAYLGLWTVAQLVFRGGGIALGGAGRDALLWLSGSFGVAYGGVFLLEAVGLLLCIPLLFQSDVRSFAAGQPPLRVSPLALAD
ncbi:MAG: BCD family MFS transporter [Chloroflexales bacterium]|nr:BCD family MFS transporter [Chloroflexales bacterium]